jgi:hypothetical protein
VLQRAEQLERLPDRHAVVELPVDEQEKRIALAAVDAGRVVHPHLDRSAVRTGVGHRFVGAQLDVREDVVVDRVDPARAAVARVDDYQPRRIVEALVETHERAVASDAERIEVGIACHGTCLPAGVSGEVVDTRRAGVVDRAVEPPAIGRPDETVS